MDLKWARAKTCNVYIGGLKNQDNGKGCDEVLNDFTDLVLLIGTNPLPNFVTAKYFVRTNKQLERIWLIFSEKTKRHGETRDLAANIKRVIKEKLKFNSIEEIPLRDIGSVPAIRQDLMRNFSSRAIGNSIFHLNYTGGTKSMAVQTYRFFEGSGYQCSFSYLDGRDFRLKYDEELLGITGDLRYEIGISLEDLIALHGYEKLRADETGAYKDTIKRFQGLIEQDKLREYLCWKDAVLRRIYYSSGRIIETTKLFLEHNKLRSNTDREEYRKCFSDKIPDFVMDLLKTLPKKKSILDESNNLWIPNSSLYNAKFCERVKVTVELLDGKWLEDYVFDVIDSSLKADSKLDPLLAAKQITIESNWEIVKKSAGGATGKKFELDVILLNGYQVCGISCTTIKKEGFSKNKGFEIVHRTRQIGGEEARSILVTCIDREGDRHNFDNFYEDLKDKTGSRSHEFTVLGLQDLKPDRLWDKIRKHVWGGI